MTVALALISSLLWGIADFLGGTATRRLPVATVVAVSQTVALVALLPFVVPLGQRPLSLVPGLVAGLVGALGLGAFYAALARGTMGVVAPIAACGAAVPVLVGLARGEAPRAVQLAGIVIVLLGVVLASGPELSGGAPMGPLLLAVVSAGCFGTVMTLIARGSRGPAGAVVVTMVLLRLSEVAVLAPVVLTRGLGAGWRAALPLLVAIGLLDVAANTSFAFASRGALLSVVGVLSSLYPVVTVLLARQVHAERLVRLQVAGVGATLLGVALLSS